MEKPLGKPVVIFSVRIKYCHPSAPLSRDSFRYLFIVRIIQYIVSGPTRQKIATYIVCETNLQGLFRHHICKKRTVRGKLARIDTVPVITNGKVSARLHGYGQSGQFPKIFLRKKVSLRFKLFVFIVKFISVFLISHTVHPQRDIGHLMPVLQGYAVLCRQVFRLLPARPLLVRPVIIQIIIGTVSDIQKISGCHRRYIEYGKTCPRQQHGGHQQVIHGLFTLKFHHTAGDQIFIRDSFFEMPAIHHRMKQHHV